MIRSRLSILPVEELANTLTHGFGLVLSLIGFVVLVVLASMTGDWFSVIGCTIYGLSLVVLYTASTMYHSATLPEYKKTLQILDHCCIYLLIAGSYTPFGILISGDTFGRILLAAFWFIAFAGIVIKLIVRDRFPAVNVLSYLGMGWLGIFAVGPLFDLLGTAPVVLAVAGGIAYTVGVIFFPMKFIRHHHAIFHIFVLAGSIFHYAAVVLYVVPHAVNI